jgi:ribosome modulation factor
MNEKDDDELDFSFYASSWRDGYAAQRVGTSQSECPDPTTSPEGKAWLAGWDKARRDAIDGDAAAWCDDPEDEDYHPDADVFAIDINTGEGLPPKD